MTPGFRNVPSERDFLLVRNMDIFFSMIREISLFYVDETEPENLINNGIRGVLQGLDPYTTYVPESEKENYATMTTGRYGGIGALIRQIGDYVMVIEPYENFPAQKSGIRAGDIITAIDGKSTKGLQVNEVSEMLKGMPNSSLEIIIHRHGAEGPISKKLLREEVKINNVTWYGSVADGIGYIQLNGFTENAHQEVRDALKDLKTNQKAESIILDLRGNPGGLLMEAVNITNLFIEKGQEIVSTRCKVKQWDHTYRARNNPEDSEIPLVVLVERSSASAAEIVSGAVQDLDRGIVMGQRTFGKGLIQTTRPLSYNAQLKITTAKYYTPSGRCIHTLDLSGNGSTATIPDSLINEFFTKNGRKVFDGGGIMPDIEVAEPVPAAILINLYTRNLIFDYATLYADRNPSIPPLTEFQITDEDYRDFINFLQERGFEYQTQTEERLRQLIAASKQENYYVAATDAFNEFEKILTHNKQQDLVTYKKEIKGMLREEIAGRYYYQKGLVKASLDDDPFVDKAIEILNNRRIYNSILNGSISYSGEGCREGYMASKRLDAKYRGMISC